MVQKLGLTLLGFCFLMGCEKPRIPVSSSRLPPANLSPKAPENTPPPVAPPFKVDWSQPPVACVEKIIPHPADRPCLDLSQIPNIMTDWPEEISDDDRAYWLTQRRGLDFCRSQELLRRENLTPGRYSGSMVQLAWMRVLAMRNHQEKIQAVGEASLRYQIPVHVLTGALYQESLFSQLGIAEDGGNYSCGMGQANIWEWCSWVQKQPDQKKIEIGFPAAAKNCSEAKLELLKPLYRIALTRLNGEPEYRLMPSHFAGIRQEDVEDQWPPATADIQKLRFDLIQAFLGNCRDVTDGVDAKANQLSDLFIKHVPSGLKAKDLYPPGKKFNRQCSQAGYEGYHPLSASWLLAVGIYNAGPRAVDAMAHYNRWTAADLQVPDTFSSFTPVQMVESFYWGGKYNPVDDLIHFTGRNGRILSWSWFKGCVLQRHIARVVQHVTEPGTPKYIDSLENGIPCRKSVFDPVTGELLQTGVPDFRQLSSGQK